LSNREIHVPADLLDWELEELRKLSDRLRKGKAHIDMKRYIAAYCFAPFECDTVACIAGHICIAHKQGDTSTVDVSWYAGDKYEKNMSIAKLFYPKYGDVGNVHWGWYATSEETADAIDRYLAGKEPWPDVKP
jgi:hypothetical protein